MSSAVETKKPAMSWNFCVLFVKVVSLLGIDIIQYKKINPLVKSINEKPEKIFGLPLHNNINTVVAQRREASTAISN